MGSYLCTFGTDRCIYEELNSPQRDMGVPTCNMKRYPSVDDIG